MKPFPRKGSTLADWTAHNIIMNEHKFCLQYLNMYTTIDVCIYQYTFLFS